MPLSPGSPETTNETTDAYALGRLTNFDKRTQLGTVTLTPAAGIQLPCTPTVGGHDMYTAAYILSATVRGLDWQSLLRNCRQTMPDAPAERSRVDLVDVEALRGGAPDSFSRSRIMVGDTAAKPSRELLPMFYTILVRRPAHLRETMPSSGSLESWLTSSISSSVRLVLSE